jgi:hypothetical protein
VAKPKAKKLAAPTKKKASGAKKKAASTKKVSGLDGHPGYVLLASKLKPGRYAGGMLLVTEFGAHDEQMSPWLLGRIEGRRAIGRTAFGDLVIFRDLRARAKELGLPDADKAGDIALIDVHYKRMTMVAESAEALLESLDRPDWQKAYLRADLYRKAKKRLGDYGEDECFFFVPALALGGSEDAASVDRGNWLVHQDILFQT